MLLCKILVACSVFFGALSVRVDVAASLARLGEDDKVQHSHSSTYNCDSELQSCQSHYPESSQDEKCQLRHDACVKGDKYFGKFGVTNQPCAIGTWNVLGQVSRPWSSCDPNTRVMKHTFINADKYIASSATDAVSAFIHQELLDTLHTIACAINCEYQDIANAYYRQSLRSRGVVDGVSLIKGLTKLASHAAGTSIPGVGGAVGKGLDAFAMSLLRHVWFKEVGSEIIGTRFKVEKWPRPHPMRGCADPAFDGSELWEVTRTESFEDASFPQYMPHTVHHVLECVGGACVDRDGNPTPPVLVSLQDTSEAAAQSALILATQQAGVTWENSEDAFMAFVGHLR